MMQKLEKMTPEGLVVGFVEKPKPKPKKVEKAEETEKPKRSKKESVE